MEGAAATLTLFCWSPAYPCLALQCRAESLPSSSIPPSPAFSDRLVPGHGILLIPKWPTSIRIEAASQITQKRFKGALRSRTETLEFIERCKETFKLDTGCNQSSQLPLWNDIHFPHPDSGSHIIPSHLISVKAWRQFFPFLVSL